MSRYFPHNLVASAVAATSITPISSSINLNGVQVGAEKLCLSNGSISAPAFFFNVDSKNTGLYYDSATTSLRSCANGTSPIIFATSAITFPSSITTTTLQATTPTIDLTSGALVCANGGMGIALNLNVTGNIIAASVATTALRAATSSIPAYTFTSDSDSGIYLFGTDQIGFMAGNTYACKLTSTSFEVNSVMTETDFLSSEQSTSPTTGSLVIAGSLRVAKNINCGGVTTCSMMSASTWIGHVTTPQLSFTANNNSGIGWIYLAADAEIASVIVAGSPVLQCVGSWPSNSNFQNKVVVLGTGSGVNVTSSDAVWVGYLPYTMYQNSVNLGNYTRAWPFAVAIGHSAWAGEFTSFYAPCCIGATAQCVITGGSFNDGLMVGYGANTTYQSGCVFGYASTNIIYQLVFGDASFGQKIVNDGTGWQQTSDERFKDDITEITIGMPLLRSLRPITYRWLKSETDNRTHMGFSYQRVRAALDELGFTDHESVDVDVDSVEHYGCVAPNAFLPHIVRAIKELDERIQRIRNKS